MKQLLAVLLLAAMAATAQTSITQLQGSDLLKNSYPILNGNFNSLNTYKLETSAFVWSGLGGKPFTSLGTSMTAPGGVLDTSWSLIPSKPFTSLGTSLTAPGGVLDTDWTLIPSKPFTSVGSGLNVSGGVLTATNTTAFPAAAVAPSWLRVKPNTGNLTTYEFVGSDYKLSTDYIFDIQSPSGTLTSGITNTVTLAPVPLGVNGSNTGHYLYIGTCSGGAQKVLITGGTAVSGTASGTITFVPTNSCNAGWTIQSATAGVAEAFWVQNNNGVVVVPAGTHAIYGQIIMNPTTGARLHCSSWASVLSAATATGNIVEMMGAYKPVIDGCKFSASVTRTGDAAIQVSNGIANENGYDIIHVYVTNQYNGIVWLSGYFRRLIDSTVQGAVSNYGLLIRNSSNGDNGDDTVTGNTFEMQGVTDIRYESAGGLKLINNKLLGCSAYAFDVYSNDTGVGVYEIYAEGNGFACSSAHTVRLAMSANPASSGGRLMFIGNHSGPIEISGYDVTRQNVELLFHGNIIVGGDGASGLPAITIGAYAGHAVITGNHINCAGTSVANCIDTSAATVTPIVIANNNVISGAPNPYSTSTVATVQDFNPGLALSKLPVAKNGSTIFCHDCQHGTSPCTASHTGAFARRVNGAWVCN